MDDPTRAIEQIMTGPLGKEIHDAHTWALTITNSDKLEIFLNPEDARGLEGCRLWGMPIRKTIGVEQGKALIFDHRSGRYIRKGEQLDHTP
ncbi:hypothetical protein AB0900_31115 [Streptomyces cellulosae]